jgi:hypothetical protein
MKIIIRLILTLSFLSMLMCSQTLISGDVRDIHTVKCFSDLQKFDLFNDITVESTQENQRKEVTRSGDKMMRKLTCAMNITIGLMLFDLIYPPSIILPLLIKTGFAGLGTYCGAMLIKTTLDDRLQFVANNNIHVPQNEKNKLYLQSFFKYMLTPICIGALLGIICKSELNFKVKAQ